MVEDFWQLLMKVVPETFRTGGANYLHGAIIKIGIFSLCYSTQWKWNHDPDLESESHPCSTFSGHMKTIKPNSKCPSGNSGQVAILAHISFKNMTLETTGSIFSPTKTTLPQRKKHQKTSHHHHKNQTKKCLVNFSFPTEKRCVFF